MERRILHAGEYHSSATPIVLSTLLGSCVAACIYDAERGIVGMNHFLLANKRYPNQGSTLATEAGRYGLYAMELLINDMLKKGARRSALKAKAFGGGKVLEQGGDNFFAVGEVNVRFIREFLNKEHIPLISADLGGNQGRVIHFTSSDYSVYVRKIARPQTVAVEQREHEYWRKQMIEEKRHQANQNAEIWLYSDRP